ncbi:MAG: hypothetical protein QOE88_381 [Verrucomicrobiota bacterium]|jgi:GMP synthase (glutamine-hydrolysing)|nr:hypothetical protein [Verrucomicrobiota bacterium]MEA3162563.1 hypothetical protein [Verrucomicrobiota bacterium]
MAAALGARVYHPGSHGKELGWAPILTASDAGAHHGFGTIISPELRILHWHGDTFDLPAGTSRLASTDRYTNQAFAAGDFALALQFHLEVTVAGLERWYVGHAVELAETGVRVPRLREESHKFDPELEIAAKQFWRQWLERVFGSAREPRDRDRPRFGR